MLTVSPSISNWKLWSLAAMVTILRAWIMPTWILWVAIMTWPRWDTRRWTVTGPAGLGGDVLDLRAPVPPGGGTESLDEGERGAREQDLG